MVGARPGNQTRLRGTTQAYLNGQQVRPTVTVQIESVDHPLGSRQTEITAHELTVPEVQQNRMVEDHVIESVPVEVCHDRKGQSISDDRAWREIRERGCCKSKDQEGREKSSLHGRSPHVVNNCNHSPFAGRVKGTRHGERIASQSGRRRR